ncbi:MAG: LysM peptidoglycan-binding domain-containing M23 family metallopeptidase [Kiloniellales bacterium]|nr:LysM peptidoglycan-binding domain-containing M23 family metallopeptidase [Kiloniellales bacterium]
MRFLSSFIVLTCVFLGLAACGGSKPLYEAGYVTPKDPPPPPRRRPPVPPGFVSAPKGFSLAGSDIASAPVTSSAIETEAIGPVSTEVRPIPASGFYVVAAGDTLFAISRLFALPIRTIIDANALRPPYDLRVGQRLKIPNPRLHRVRPGETVYGISRLYGVEMSELMRLNNVAPPYTIAVGTDLVLPGPTQAQNGAEAAITVAQPTSPAVGPVDKPVLAVPTAPSASGAGANNGGFELGALPRRKPQASHSTANTGGAAGSKQAGTSGSQATQSAAVKPPEPPKRTGGKFLWPVQGRIVSEFGPQGSGRHNDGINILAPRGAPVRAAENGVVVYVGSQLQGFGNLLLVKHSDGWLTAYAHTESILVSKGDVVKRGQTLARVGSSGNVASPQLHFEVRKGKRAIDPMRILAPSPA